MKGISGAEALNKAFRYGGDAGRYSAQVTNAFLGTEPNDLSRLVASAGRSFGAFASREADLQGLIDNFDTFTGALADQSDNLATTVRLLAPTLKVAQASLVSLNRTLPPLRTYAIELTPAVAELPELIRSSEPWLAQVRPLLSGKEAGGVAKLLAESTPGLAGAAQAGKAKTLPQLNRLSLCTTKVLVPTGNQVIEDRFSTGGPNYREFFFTLADFAGAGAELRRQRAVRPVADRRRRHPGRRTEPDGEPGHRSATRSTTPGRGRTRRQPAAAGRAEPPHQARSPLRQEPGARRQRGPGRGRPADAVGRGGEPVTRRPTPRPAAGGTSKPGSRARPAATAKTRSRSSSSPSPAIVMMLGIFTQQKASLPSWLPFVGEEFEHITAEFTTAQAVTPGQGQAVDVAGIQIGKVASVDLEDGHAVVGMEIEPKYMELIHPNAQLLLRPKTGLNDMIVEIEPGSGSEAIEDGHEFTLAQTEPNTNLDEFLASLDADTRQYLQLLVAGGAQGIGGRGKQLGNALRRFAPVRRIHGEAEQGGRRPPPARWPG